MGVPLFDPATPLAGLRRRLGEAIDEVLDRGQFILGPEVAAFEHELAAYLGIEHAVGVANGTEALTIALRALGVGPGDDVVVPSFSFYASAEAVPPTGARPVFCDVDPDTYCATPDTVKAALTPRTKAVDRRRPVRQRRAGARDRGARRAGVEDAAQAVGSTGPDGPRRRARHAGDALVLPVEEPRRLRRRRRGHHRRRGPGRARARCCASTARATRSATSRSGYNSRLDELQAAILRVQLPSSSAGPTHRHGVGEWYAQAGLGELVALQRIPPGTRPAWHVYVVRHERRRRPGRRPAARPASASRAYYRTPIHRQPAMAAFARRRAARDRRAGPHAPRPAGVRGHAPRPGRRGRRRRARCGSGLT